MTSVPVGSAPLAVVSGLLGNSIFLVGSFVLLLLGAEIFTNGVEWLGQYLGLGDSATGSILAAVGTALPETLIPVIAILGAYLSGEGSESASDIGVGAILGARFLLATIAMSSSARAFSSSAAGATTAASFTSTTRPPSATSFTSSSATCSPSPRRSLPGSRRSSSACSSCSGTPSTSIAPSVPTTWPGTRRNLTRSTSGDRQTVRRRVNHRRRGSQRGPRRLDRGAPDADRARGDHRRRTALRERGELLLGGGVLNPRRDPLALARALRHRTPREVQQHHLDRRRQGHPRARQYYRRDGVSGNPPRHTGDPVHLVGPHAPVGYHWIPQRPLGRARARERGDPLRPCAPGHHRLDAPGSRFWWVDSSMCCSSASCSITCL